MIRNDTKKTPEMRKRIFSFMQSLKYPQNYVCQKDSTSKTILNMYQTLPYDFGRFPRRKFRRYHGGPQGTNITRHNRHVLECVELRGIHCRGGGVNIMKTYTYTRECTLILPSRIRFNTPTQPTKVLAGAGAYRLSARALRQPGGKTASGSLTKF